MDWEMFKEMLREEMPSVEFKGPLLALWKAGRGDWDGAHAAVQDDPGKEAAWVHAYLHRVEGDLGNASYWYRRAGKPVAEHPLELEWEELVKAFLK